MATPSIHSISFGSYTVVPRIIEINDAIIKIIIVTSFKASTTNLQNGVGGGGSTLFTP